MEPIKKIELNEENVKRPLRQTRHDYARLYVTLHDEIDMHLNMIPFRWWLKF